MNVAQATAIAMLSAANVLMNNGTLVFYSGTQPATPETALSGNAVIATFTFSATAFATPTFSAGFASSLASFVSSSVTAVATGNPTTFARAYASNGTTAVQDYTIGTSGTDITVATTNIPSGTTVTISSLINRIAAS
jgi:hypothetical protein